MLVGIGNGRNSGHGQGILDMDCQLKRMPRIDGRVKSRQAFPYRIVRMALTLLLPEYCPSCGKASGQAGFCQACSASLARHDRQCRRCGVPFTGNAVCGPCQRFPSPIDETIAPFKYTAPVSDAIHRLKYHRQLACGRDLGYLLAGELRWRISALPDVLVPVPLHWRRRFERGFNQSLEIAEPISTQLGVPIQSDLVRRRTHTSPQVGKMPAQRRRNMRRVFHVPDGKPPAHVAILDDVITSGATASELALCLRRAGTERVSVWAVTRV